VIQFTRSFACENRKHANKSTTGSPEIPGLPCANGFNGLLRALPGDRAFLPPSSAGNLFRQLDASVEASGPRSFAVRTQHIRLVYWRVHRIPLPTSVTIAKRPSFENGINGILLVICALRQIGTTGKSAFGEATAVNSNVGVARVHADGYDELSVPGAALP
jgi:hypothetical protein